MKHQSSSRPDSVCASRRFLIDLIQKNSLDPDSAVSWLTDQWDQITKDLLVPWLHKSLPPNVRKVLPQDLENRLNTSYQDSTKVSLVQEALLTKVLKHLNSHGIPVIVLKGVFLWHVVYNDPATRPISDIDLLVRDQDFERARGLLVQLGFEQSVELPLPEDLKEFLQPAVAHYMPGPIPIIVDLHRSLLYLSFYRISSTKLWPHAKETIYNGQPVLILPPELNFVLCALNNLNHGSLLRDWLDLMLILCRLQFDWSRLLAFAHSLGVLRPLRFILNHLQVYWNIAIPYEVLENVQKYEPHWLENRVIISSYRYIWQMISRVVSIPGWRMRLQYLRLIVLPSRIYRESATGTGGWFHYIRSKCELLMRLGRSDF